MVWKFTADSLAVSLDILGVIALLVALVIALVALRWRKEYQRRMAELEARMVGHRFAPVTRMVRVKEGVLTHSNSNLVKMCGFLDLREEFRSREGGGGVPPPGKPAIDICSISDYLMQLRPEEDANKQAGGKAVVEEVDAILTQAIVKAVGPTAGSIVVPLLGQANLANSFVNVAVAKGLLTKDEGSSVGGAVHQMVTKAWEAVTNMSLMGIGFGADSYVTYKQFQQRASSGAAAPLLQVDAEKGELPRSTWNPPPPAEGGRDAVSLMRWGEAKAVTFPAEAFPNPFVMEIGFEAAQQLFLNMEKEAAEKAGIAFYPDAYPVDVPTPIDPITLPGLHKGFGGAVKTQTYREIACARTLNVILNRLASNDTRSLAEPKFKVNIGRREVTRPEDFVQGLLDTGHEIALRPRFNTVSFGFGLCIKEDDGTWTNVPWALVFRSGYEDMYGRPASCALNHGGINLNIQGPIVKKASTQHHNAIDGVCGWYTNETCNVPWLAEKIELGDGPIFGQAVVRAARLLGLYATVINSIATRMKLPFGGYGCTGVCLDSSAVIEKALFGKATSYPMLHVGRFHMHAIREARSFLHSLQVVGDHRADDMKAVIAAMESLPTDTGASPQLCADTARRIIACTPKSLPFKIMERSVEACRSIIAEQEAAAGVLGTSFMNNPIKLDA